MAHFLVQIHHKAEAPNTSTHGKTEILERRIPDEKFRDADVVRAHCFCGANKTEPVMLQDLGMLLNRSRFPFQLYVYLFQFELQCNLMASSVSGNGSLGGYS